ncbi:MAG: hypothetical protein ACE5PO_00395 [Candidatus Bathyarchaeia archaeon]
MSDREKKLKKLDALIEAFNTGRLKWLIGLSAAEVKVHSEKHGKFTDIAMKDELERRIILGELKKTGPLTISQLTQATGIDSKRLLDHVIALRKLGSIKEAGEQEDEYLYQAV